MTVVPVLIAFWSVVGLVTGSILWWWHGLSDTAAPLQKAFLILILGPGVWIFLAIYCLVICPASSFYRWLGRFK